MLKNKKIKFDGVHLVDINNLVEKCINSAIEYGFSAFEVVENSRKTNRLYDKNFKNFKTLKGLGSEGIVELEKLLDHSNDYVKYSSATHLLSVKEEKAKEVLKQLGSKPQLFGFSVEMLISEWDNGNLKDLV
ncbi:DUF2019 domain-containing protein [Lysinibacillus composti]|uniref:DUF2019 domain-containing protein n=1 Tax=Lysinibacillus composti TaxID=720633 RepID=A0A3N9UEL4_9BACI|nr:DUF2019 domain-containing protein [Lysinibacillus composti]RQW74674.1 DUF2019 domain-containing protein [Lysinibacillus composti]